MVRVYGASFVDFSGCVWGYDGAEMIWDVMNFHYTFPGKVSFGTLDERWRGFMAAVLLQGKWKLSLFLGHGLVHPLSFNE